MISQVEALLAPGTILPNTANRPLRSIVFMLHVVQAVYVTCIYLTEVPVTPFLPHPEQSYRRFNVLWRGFPCWFTRDGDRPEAIPS